MRDRVLHHGVGALHVQVADGIPLGLLELGQPGAVVGAGVVDEHVQTAPLGNDLFVQFLNGLVVAQVDGLGHDFVVGVDLLERCQSLGTGLFIVAQEVHFGTRSEKALDGREADAATTTGNKNDLTFEFVFKHVFCPFLTQIFDFFRGVPVPSDSHQQLCFC